MPYPFTTWVEEQEEEARALAKYPRAANSRPFDNTWLVPGELDPDAILTADEYMKWVVGGEGWLYSSLSWFGCLRCSHFPASFWLVWLPYLCLACDEARPLSSPPPAGVVRAALTTGAADPAA